jgi:hypothetical protein
MNDNFADRWLRGFGFFIRVWFALFVAFGPASILALIANDADTVPSWVGLVLGLIAIGYSLILGPVVLGWISEKVGFSLGRRNNTAAGT